MLVTVLRYLRSSSSIDGNTKFTRQFSFSHQQIHVWIASVSVFTVIVGSAIISAADADDDKNLPVYCVISNLRKTLREDQIETDEEELKARGKPWNSYHKCSLYPDAIIYPESTEEVAAIVRECNRQKVPIICYGGGTSIEGQTLALRGGISMDMNRMTSLLSLHPEDLDCTVQAGLGYIQLNDILKEKGLWFPLDPGPGASIGGMCATRCSGSTALRYGSMRENVLSVTAVLADGSIIHTGGRARKSSAGYDITRLLIGSEGTLAIITEVTLKMHRIPSHAVALRVTLPSIGAAAALARESLIQFGTGVIGRIELLDSHMIQIMNQANSGSSLSLSLSPSLSLSSSSADLSSWPEYPTLLFEVSGFSETGVQEALNSLISLSLSPAFSASHIYSAKSAEECSTIWKMRKECLWSAMSVYPDREAMITDVCVPLSSLPSLITSSRLALDQSHPHLPSPIIAHAGDGNFHVLLMIRPDNNEDAAEASRLSTLMASQAIALGGTCTGEHGIGSGKKKLLEREMGEGTMSVMHLIKQSLDPNYILNPEKVLSSPSLSSSDTSSSSLSLSLSSSVKSSSTHICS